MKAPLNVRLLVLALVIVPLLGGLALYVATRDWEHLGRQYELGHKPTFPPRAKHGPKSPVVDSAQKAITTATDILTFGAQLACAIAIAILAIRARARRRRMRTIERWELRLGRDDQANPYHVQEAFEGIAGAIGVRWYERLWRGPEHLALEIHRLHDASIRFVIAAPHYLQSAIQGPLEDLYPDVELIARDGQPDSSRCVVRLKKRASFVLSIQTTRNYEHAFCESLVALIDKGTDDLSVQLVLTPASGFVHR